MRQWKSPFCWLLPTHEYHENQYPTNKSTFTEVSKSGWTYKVGSLRCYVKGMQGSIPVLRKAKHAIFGIAPVTLEISTLQPQKFTQIQGYLKPLLFDRSIIMFTIKRKTYTLAIESSRTLKLCITSMERSRTLNSVQDIPMKTSQT